MNDEPEATVESAPELGPDAYVEAISRQVRLARIMEEPAVVTWWLLGANVAIWIAGVVYGWAGLVEQLELSHGGFKFEQLSLYTGMKVDHLIDAGQWWRLFSSQFVHLDILHIVFNGYGLYILGPILERFYGRKRFFFLYLASGTIAAVASYWFTVAASGGASGAIYGLVGGIIVFGIKYRDSLPDRLSRAFTVGLLPWVVLSLGIGFLESVPMDNGAHLGGLFAGAFIALFMRSRVRRTTTRSRDRIIWGATMIGVAALVYTAAHWSDEITHCTESKQTYVRCYPELADKIGGRSLEVPER